MRIFHIKSIILGVGIGVILTSVVSIIYLAGINPNEKMSREEIMAEAKKLGMVESTALISDKNESADTPEEKINEEKLKTDETQKVETQNETGQQGQANNDINQQEQTPPVEKQETPAAPEMKEVEIIVSPGDTSEKVADKLLAAGLISDKTEFIDQLTNMGLASEINIGNFKFITGTDVNVIIKTITTAR